MSNKNIDWSNLGFGYIQTDKRYVSDYKDGFWDQGVKDMLYRAAGVDDVPLPNGLPAARNITRNVIPYNTVYIERKKELLKLFLI